VGNAWLDAAHDAATAEQRDRALEEAFAAAQRVAESFTADRQADPLAPQVSVTLEVGAEDQPLFVFSLLVALPDDLDADAYPGAEVEALKSDLGGRISDTALNWWDWLVTTRAQAGAAPR
jgi:hypothetical protein